MPTASAIQQFTRSLQGRLLRPAEAEYERERRVFNAMIDRRPALIARCASASDVSASIRFAREHGMTASVCGGGHSVAGKAVADGVLMIDLREMKTVEVDPQARTAVAAAGLRLGELDRATQEHGLATPLGIVTDTGIAGLTLGGGMGWLNGKYGFTCDNVLEFEVVTADGEIRRASPEQHPDLFWALRGGSGNFGVVTCFKYRLHQVGPVFAGMVMHPADSVEALRFLMEFSAAAPDELTCAAAVVPTPEGSSALALVACYCGGVAEGEKVLEPLRKYGEPLADTFGVMEYSALQSILDGAFPPGQHQYWKAAFVDDLPEDAARTLLESAQHRPSLATVTYVFQVHGAAARVPADATAYAHRAPQYEVAFLSQWGDAADTEKNLEWTRAAFAAMKPYLAHRVYVNVLGDEGEERIREAYGENYSRLARIKAKYDPGNFFRLNQNIRPAPEETAA